MVLKQVVYRVGVVAREALGEGRTSIAVPCVRLWMLIFEFLVHEGRHLHEVKELARDLARLLLVEDKIIVIVVLGQLLVSRVVLGVDQGSYIALAHLENARIVCLPDLLLNVRKPFMI